DRPPPATSGFSEQDFQRNLRWAAAFDQRDGLVQVDVLTSREDHRGEWSAFRSQKLLDTPGDDLLVAHPRLLQLGRGHARTLARGGCGAHPRTTSPRSRKV